SLYAAVSIEPAQDLCDAPSRQRDAGIGGTVVQVDAVAVERVPARKGHVADVAFAFIGRFRSEDPRVATQYTSFGRFQIEERGPEPVQAAGSGSPDTVVQHEPS